METIDPHDTPEYQAFVEEMAKRCNCRAPFDRPCAGLLAGGLCDELGQHTGEVLRDFDEEDEP